MECKVDVCAWTRRTPLRRSRHMRVAPAPGRRAGGGRCALSSCRLRAGAAAAAGGRAPRPRAGRARLQAPPLGPESGARVSWSQGDSAPPSQSRTNVSATRCTAEPGAHHTSAYAPPRTSSLLSTQQRPRRHRPGVPTSPSGSAQTRQRSLVEYTLAPRSQVSRHTCLRAPRFMP